MADQEAALAASGERLRQDLQVSERKAADERQMMAEAATMAHEAEIAKASAKAQQRAAEERARRLRVAAWWAPSRPACLRLLSAVRELRNAAPGRTPDLARAAERARVAVESVMPGCVDDWLCSRLGTVQMRTGAALVDFASTGDQGRLLAALDAQLAELAALVQHFDFISRPDPK